MMEHRGALTQAFCIGSLGPGNWLCVLGPQVLAARDCSGLAAYLVLCWGQQCWSSGGGGRESGAWRMLLIWASLKHSSVWLLEDVCQPGAVPPGVC